MQRIFLLPVLLLFLTGVARAQNFQNQIERIGDRDRNVMLMELTVSPQAVPEPALKYPLAWGFDQRVRANAATKYNMAMRELAQLRFQHLNQLARELEQKFNAVLTTPEVFQEKKAALEAFEKELAEMSEADAERARHEAALLHQTVAYSHYCAWPRDRFPMDQAREFVARFRNAYRHLEEGSRRDFCDWEYPIRGNRDPISILLPEVQEIRDLARALQVKARLEIYEGRYADAVQTIRVGKTLARHTAETPIIVSQLVGIAIDGIMNFCLFEMMQQEDAPNLYWSLTAMPGPLFPPTESFAAEMDWARLMVPELAKAMDTPDEMTDDDWRSLDRTLRNVVDVFVDDFSRDNNVSGMMPSGLIAYPHAKQWLIEQGHTAEAIEAMPTAKVIGLWSVHRFQVNRDNVRKVIQLPFWQLRGGPDVGWEQNDLDNATPLGRFANLLFPATNAYLNAVTRANHAHELMRIVEAIRAHAAVSGGQLPLTLDEIQCVPVPPFDPYSGKPFDYKIQDGAAVIESDAGHSIIRLVIRLRLSEPGFSQDFQD